MSLIACCGKKQVGKNTFADECKGFIQYAFAKPLKDTCKVLFLLSDEQLYGNLKEIQDKRWGKSPREIMQQFGKYGQRKGPFILD